MKQVRGRESVTLTNRVVRATFLPHGGHLSAFGFEPAAGEAFMNTLWQPPYETADPGSAAFSALASHYGGGATGKFLAAFTGHALCLDQFGMPSQEDEAEGVGLHGEAALAHWQMTASSPGGLTATASLPVSGLEVTREISMLAAESVLRVVESVSNTRSADRPIHWVQHATLGPPFLNPRDAALNASVSDGIVWPHGYEGKECLRSGATFVWPLAPRNSPGGELDLRLPFQINGCGFVAAAMQQERDISYVAALNWRLGIAMGYCFRRPDYPWLTLWEENAARSFPPWNGQVRARGLEFGTTPFPLGREACREQGVVLGQRTDRIVPGNSTVHAPWAQFLVKVPGSWRGIADIQVQHDAIVLWPVSGQPISIPARGIREFLGEDR